MALKPYTQNTLVPPETFQPETPLEETARLADEESVSFGEQFSAALKTENVVGSWLAREEWRAKFEEGYTDREVPEDFNPIVYAGDRGKGHEDAIGAFETPKQTDWYLYQVEQEERQREVISSSGLGGFAATMGAVGLDPVVWATMLIPGGGAGRAAQFARYGAAAAAGEMVSQVGLHATQETRTIKESALSVGAAVLLGGTLGALAKTTDPGNVAKMTRDVASDFENPTTSTVGAAARAMDPADSELTRALKATAQNTPVDEMSSQLRLMASDVGATRDAAQRLIDPSLYIKGNFDGVASHQSAELGIKAQQADLADVLWKVKDEIAAHRKAGGKLSNEDFRIEVGKALRRGDVHDDPAVAAAAKRTRKTLDRIKREAIENGLLDEDVTTKFADSYLPRVYNTDKIRENYKGFVDAIEPYVKNYIPEGLEAGTYRQVAEDIADQILGAPHSKTPRTFNVRHASGTKERVLNVPDTVLEPYLHSDISYVMSRHFDDMVPEIEVAKMFDGDVNMESAIQAIKDEYRPRIDNAKSSKAADKVRKKRDREIRTLTALRDVMLGQYEKAGDPHSMVTRALKGARAINYMRLLGGMTVSAIPDLARTTMVHGLTPTMRVLTKMMFSPGSAIKASAEMRRLGVGLDMILNSRVKAIAELGMGTARKGAWERAQQGFGIATLMNPWNTAMKRMAGFVSQDVIMRSANNVQSGRGISKNVRRKLARLGLDEDDLREIAKQYQKHGADEGGLRLAQVQNWDNPEIARKYQNALIKDVDTMIVTPGVSDVPLAAHSAAGKTIFQFKSFSFAATNQMLLSGLQGIDLAFMNGIALSVALGALAHNIKSVNRPNGKLDTDPTSLVLNGIDRSGVLGSFMEVNNMAEKFTGGRVGMSSMFGQSAMSRYASRDALEALAGPTAGFISTAARASAGVFGEGWRESDIHAMRKLVPYSNVFWYRKAVDALEENVNEMVGAER